jgi:hypothetical protein
MSKRYYFHSDAGHGWLAVKRTELVRLNLSNKISSFSYERGGTVYLEEDCDASCFLKAKKDLGEEFTFKETHVDRSPIRSYKSYVNGLT